MIIFLYFTLFLALLTHPQFFFTGSIPSSRWTKPSRIYKLNIEVLNFKSNRRTVIMPFLFNHCKIFQSLLHCCYIKIIGDEDGRLVSYHHVWLFENIWNLWNNCSKHKPVLVIVPQLLNCLANIKSALDQCCLYTMLPASYRKWLSISSYKWIKSVN